MNLIKNILFYIRFVLFRNYREKKLIKIFSQEIKKLFYKDNTSYRILDFGSGMQPIIICDLIKLLNNNDKNITFYADCYDFYDEKKLNILNLSNKNINFFHLNNLNLKNKYDLSLIIDVLHHIDMTTLDKHKKILSDIKLISSYIFIKDHFQYSLISNFILRLMDFVGNFHNNVFLPKIYFTEKIFLRFIDECKIKEIKRITNQKFYRFYWFFFSNPKLHFISILESKKND